MRYILRGGEPRIKAGTKVCIQLETIDVEGRDCPVLGNAQNRPLQPPHSVPLGMDYVGQRGFE